MQLEWTELSAGELLQRFGSFHAHHGAWHMLEDVGHLAEVIGEEFVRYSHEEGNNPAVNMTLLNRCTKREKLRSPATCRDRGGRPSSWQKAWVLDHP